MSKASCFSWKKVWGLIPLVIGCSSIPIEAQQPDALNGKVLAKGGVFTTEQAIRGKKAYADKCAECHGDSLEGGRGGRLVGPGFLDSTGYMTMDRFYDYVSRVMPLNNPGSLDADTYAAIVAFILSQNGAAPGDKPFDGTSSQRIDAIEGISSHSH